jgi:hypothetical protein
MDLRKRRSDALRNGPVMLELSGHAANRRIGRRDVVLERRTDALVASQDERAEPCGQTLGDARGIPERHAPPIQPARVALRPIARRYEVPVVVSIDPFSSVRARRLAGDISRLPVGDGEPAYCTGQVVIDLNRQPKR